MDEFTFALDAAPLSPDFHRPVDHSGCQLSEYIVAPLVSGDDIGLADLEPGPSRDCWNLFVKGLDVSGTRAENAMPSAERIAAHLAAYFRADGAAHRRGQLVGSQRVRVSTLGSRVVRLRTDEPIAHLPALLGHVRLAPRAGVLGAYRLAEATGGRFELVRNEYRPDLRSLAIPERVRARVVADPMAAIDLFDQGRIAMTAVTGMSRRALDSVAGRAELHSRPLDIFGHLAFGRAAADFQRSAELRRALGGVLSPAELCSAAGALVDVHPHADLERREPSATDSLVSALRRAGSILYADFAPNDVIVAELVARLDRALGIRLTPVAASLGQYATRIAHGDFGLAYTLTVPDLDHPAATLLPWHSTAPSARQTGFRDAVFDALLDAASAEDTEASWAAARRRLDEQAPQLPLTRVVAHYLVAQDCRQLAPRADGTIPVRAFRTGSTPTRSEGTECRT